MKIRGNGEGKVVIGFSVIMAIASIWAGAWQRVLTVLLLWLVFYATCLWVREIEITDSELIIKRLGRQVNIRKSSITDVDIKKHTIIIYSGRYSGVNFYRNQIQKEDLPKLIEYLSKYTGAKS